MNTLCLVVFAGALAFAHAGLVGPALIGGIHGGAIDSAAILKGPSGIVARTGISVAAAPAIVGLGAHGIIGAPALGLGLGAHGLGLGLGGIAIAAPGSGIEGQWIPDINEKLHDDGSYKPHIYGH